MAAHRSAVSGITLIEVMVSMAIFGLIGTAGFTMLDQTLRSRSQTEGRLERLGDLQRSMYLINLDFMQAVGRSLQSGSDDNGTIVTLRRAGAQGEIDLRYVLREQLLLREIGQPPETQVQILLDRVENATVRYLVPGETEWRDTWPVKPDEVASNPVAIEFTLTLSGAEGGLRRLVILPDDVP